MLAIILLGPVYALAAFLILFYPALAIGWIFRWLNEQYEDWKYIRLQKQMSGGQATQPKPPARSNHHQVNRLTMQDRDTLRLIGKQVRNQ